MRAHIIESGRVINTIVVESLDFMPNLIDASLGGEIGNLWDGVNFTKSPEQIAAEEAYQAEQARIEAKRQAIIDNLPSWAQVEAAINGIANLADAKAFLLKLSRVLCWIAKDTKA